MPGRPLVTNLTPHTGPAVADFFETMRVFIHTSDRAVSIMEDNDVRIDTLAELIEMFNFEVRRQIAVPNPGASDLINDQAISRKYRIILNYIEAGEFDNAMDQSFNWEASTLGHNFWSIVFENFQRERQSRDEPRTGRDILSGTSPFPPPIREYGRPGALIPSDPFAEYSKKRIRRS